MWNFRYHHHYAGFVADLYLIFPRKGEKTPDIQMGKFEEKTLLVRGG